MKLKDLLKGGLLGGGIMLFALLGMEYAQVLDWLLPKNLSSLGILLLIVSFILAPIFAILMHELGHLLMGLFLGFRFYFFVVGFLGIRRNKQGKIEIYLNRSLELFGGVAATAPLKDSPQNIPKFAQVIIAGPIASLLFALLVFALSFAFSEITRMFLVISGISSLGIFLATTLPRKTGVFFTDRVRYQRLTQNQQTAEIEAALMRCNIEILTENSFKNLKTNDLALIQSDKDDFIKLLGHFFAYKHYQENNQTDLASTEKELIQKFEKIISPAMMRFLEE
ncbi:MAG: M50 family metallopeptidase [Microscillaceae bacterium]|nr:M50 family metallopeptidase [Microscillaceae bacterium]